MYFDLSYSHQQCHKMFDLNYETLNMYDQFLSYILTKFIKNSMLAFKYQ